MDNNYGPREKRAETTETLSFVNKRVLSMMLLTFFNKPLFLHVCRTGLLEQASSPFPTVFSTLFGLAFAILSNSKF